MGGMNAVAAAVSVWLKAVPKKMTCKIFVVHLRMRIQRCGGFADGVLKEEVVGGYICCAKTLFDAFVGVHGADMIWDVKP
jgi:hypothetical protein